MVDISVLVPSASGQSPVQLDGDDGALAGRGADRQPPAGHLDRSRMLTSPNRPRSSKPVVDAGSKPTPSSRIRT
jgi:hypothetical protein